MFCWKEQSLSGFWNNWVDVKIFWLNIMHLTLLFINFNLYLLQLGVVLPSASELKRLFMIYGHFENGKLNGVVTVTFVDSSTIEGFIIDNVFHGMVRHLVRSMPKNGRRKRYNSEALNLKSRREQNGIPGSGNFLCNVLTFGALSAHGQFFRCELF